MTETNTKFYCYALFNRGPFGLFGQERRVIDIAKTEDEALENSTDYFLSRKGKEGRRIIRVWHEEVSDEDSEKIYHTVYIVQVIRKNWLRLPFLEEKDSCNDEQSARQLVTTLRGEGSCVDAWYEARSVAEDASPFQPFQCEREA